MLVLQKGLILPVPMYGGSYFFIQPDFVNPFVNLLIEKVNATLRSFCSQTQT